MAYVERANEPCPFENRRPEVSNPHRGYVLYVGFYDYQGFGVELTSFFEKISNISPFAAKAGFSRNVESRGICRCGEKSFPRAVAGVVIRVDDGTLQVREVPGQTFVHLFGSPGDAFDLISRGYAHYHVSTCDPPRIFFVKCHLVLLLYLRGVAPLPFKYLKTSASVLSKKELLLPKFRYNSKVLYKEKNSGFLPKASAYIRVASASALPRTSCDFL